MNNLLSRHVFSARASKSLSFLFTATLLATSLLVYFPLQSASAQILTVTTSADSHGKRFFGQGVLQVVITNPNADDDDTQEDITVDIDANPQVGTPASGSFVIPETAIDSGKFEFFIAHADASNVLPSTIVTINQNGAHEYGVLSSPPNAEAPFIRFGPGEELGIDSDLYEPVSLDIVVDDEEITVFYDESSGDLQLDRSTYGSTSFVHMFIVDQDANEDPTNSDSFDVSPSDLNGALFETEGASFASTVNFLETGVNTARFEAVLELGTDIIPSDEVLQVTLSEKANYDEPASTVNNSEDTSSRSFDIDNADGELYDIGAVTFGTELKLALQDNDQNRDSADDESLADVVAVYSDAVGGDVEFLDLIESDDNTGVFILDLANNELPITFLPDGALPVVNNSRLELRQSDISKDIIVQYTDPLNDDGGTSVTSSLTTQLTIATGSVDVPDTAGINDNFVLTITDPDLNDNPRIRDSYTFVLIQEGPYDLRRSGNPIGDLASLEFDINGQGVDLGGEIIAYTIVETDINSGVFTTQINMQDFLDFGDDGNPIAVNDGNILQVTYNDLMGETAQESIDRLTIGKAVTPPGDSENACMGQDATIIGTEGNDILNGTSGPDVIVGLRGNDIINGLGGDDIICGGLGQDQLNGGDGADKLLGGNENDAIDGGDGNDMLWGGTGWDRLMGGAGSDIIRGGIGNDRLLGGDGNDKLYGQDGVDKLDGGAGINVLVQD